MTIKLTDIIHIDDPSNYKLHLASASNGTEPLDVYVSKYSDWLGWNQSRGNKDDWTKKFIFALIEFYPRKDSWLFGGIFEVIAKHQTHYDLKEIVEYKKYVGRFLLHFHRKQGLRGRAFLLENYIDQFDVTEIFHKPYDGENFPGFERICHDFHILEPIFQSEKSDWKSPLSSVKGVYIISDQSNGKQYVGSAYGDMGIWSRWLCYMNTGHGWNDDLTRLIDKDRAYARKHFRMSLIEIMPMSTADEFVLERESYWKKVLFSREHGYNNN